MFIPAYRISIDLNEGRARLRKIVEGRSYYLIPADSVTFSNGQLGENQTLWMAEDRSEVICLDLKVDEGKILWRKEPAILPDGRCSVDVASSRKVVAGRELIEAEFSCIDHGLSLLGWFTPNTIKGYIDPDNPGTLARFELNLDKAGANEETDGVTLIFNTREGRAYSESTFPGFFIARKQKVPILMKHPTSLLLENDDGLRQAVVRPQPISLLFMNLILRHFGDTSLSPLIERFVHEVQETRVIKDDYFVYAINEEGKLETSDPTALAYLLVFYLAHGDRDNILLAIAQFKDLGRRAAFPEVVQTLLDQLSIPLLMLQDDLSEEIALKLLAIRTENALLHEEGLHSKLKIDIACASQGSSREVPYGLIQYLLLQSKYSSYVTKLDQKSPPYLTEFEELFLFKRLEIENNIIVNFGIEMVGRGEHLARQIGIDGLASHLMMLPRVRERYEALRVKYGEDASWGRRVEEYLGMVLDQTDNHHPTLASQIQRFLPDALHPNRNPRIAIAKAFLTFITRNTLRQPRAIAKESLDKMLSCKRTLEQLPLDVEGMTREMITENFPLYYRLATGEIPYSMRDHEEAFEAMATRFRRSITLKQGLHDSNVRYLIMILRTVATGGLVGFYQSADTIDQSLDRIWVFNELELELAPLQGYLAHLEMQLEIVTHQPDKPLIREEKQEIENKIAPLKRKIQDMGHTRGYYEKELLSRLNGMVTRCRAAEVGQSIFSRSSLEILTGAATVTAMNHLHTMISYALGLQQIKWAYDTGCQALSLFHKVDRLANLDNGAGASADSACAVGAESELTPFIQREEAISTCLTHYSHTFFSLLEVPTFEEERAELSEDLSRDFYDLARSLRDYYNRPVARKVEYTLREGITPARIQEDLTTLRAEVTNALKKNRKAIITLANAKEEVRLAMNEEERARDALAPTIRNDRFLTYVEILEAYASDREGELLVHPNMNEVKLAEITDRITLDLIMQSRFNLLFKKMDRCGVIWTEGDLEEIAVELERRRLYRFENETPYSLKAKLLFEANNGVLLWQKQNGVIDKLVHDQTPTKVAELLMGQGKTSTIVPLTSKIQADGNTLVVAVWPAPAAPTNTDDLARVGRKAFKSGVNVLECTRQHKEIACHWATTKMEERALLKGEPVNTTKASMQAKELVFLEELIDVHGKFGNMRDRESRLEEQRKGLYLMRDKGKARVDEMHKAALAKQQLKHPIGKKKTLDEEQVTLMKEIMILLGSLDGLREVIGVKTPKPSPLEEEKYRDVVLKRLACEVVKLPQFAELADPRTGPDQFTYDQEELITYLSGEATTLPKCVFEADTEQRKLYGMAKGILSKILPLSLSREINVDFGVSKTKGEIEEFARPSDGNDNPDDSSTIKNPIEAFIKTCLLLLHKRLDDRQLKLFIRTLKTKAEEESQTSGTFITDTTFARFFSKICLGYRINQVGIESNPEVLDLMRASDRVTMNYAAWFIAKQITYFPANFSSNPSNFFSMFVEVIGMTGTLYNEGAYPQGGKMIRDAGTVGEAIAIFKKQCAEPGSIQVLESESASDILDEMIERYFETDPKVCTIIDGGALLNGLSNEAVAERLLAYAIAQRPDKDGVVFYDSNKREVIWEKGANEPILLSASGVPPERRFCYHPQPYTYASDIKKAPDAVAINTIGEKSTFEGKTQAMFRMRGIKKGQKILTVMTPKVQALVSVAREPTADDIIRFTSMNQDKVVSQGNFQADLQKMQDCLRSAVMRKILIADNVYEMEQIAKDFIDLFIEETVDDPFQLYGGIDTVQFPEKILNALRDNLRKRMEESGLFDRPEEKMIWRNLSHIGGGVYPEFIPGYFSGDGEIDISSYTDLGQEVSVQQSTEQSQETEEENEVDQETEQNTELQSTPPDDRDRNRYPGAFPWGAGVRYSRPDSWFNPMPPEAHVGPNRWKTATNFVYRKGKEEEETPTFYGAPPHFSVTDALLAAEHEDIQFLATTLSPLLFTTANLFQLVNKGSNSKPVEPCSKYQKPPIHILTVLRADGSRQLLLLDQAEAYFLRDCIDSDFIDGFDSKKPRSVHPGFRSGTIEWRGEIAKLGIYDLENDLLIVKNYKDFDTEELKSCPETQLALVQLKFLKGVVHYSPEEREILLEWIRASNPYRMEMAFTEIHDNTGLSPFIGSVIDGVFSEAKGIKPEESLRL